MKELNKVVKKRKYTLPIITDILRIRKGHEFLTMLDIYIYIHINDAYTFALDNESSNMCTIIMSFVFGPFCYNRVPMELVYSPRFAQFTMEEILRGIDETEVYIV